jgi:hypothetical protein
MELLTELQRIMGVAATSGQENQKQLTDIQMLTLAVAVIVPLSLLLYSNSRITEAKETLRADIRSVDVKIDGLSTEIKALNKRLEEKLEVHFEHMEMRLKLHELEHHGKKPE